MNPLKFCMLAALASLASAQDATSTTATAGSTAGGDIAVTKEELNAIITEIQALAATDPDIAAIFNTIDLDALLQLSPAQAREVLNEKVFDAMAPPSNASGSNSSSDSGSVDSDIATLTPPATVPAPSSDASVETKSPAVPVPAPAGSAASSLATTSLTALAVGVAATVFAA